MNIIDIILKKKNKEILTEEEIKYVVETLIMVILKIIKCQHYLWLLLLMI